MISIETLKAAKSVVEFHIIIVPEIFTELYFTVMGELVRV
jgi:hypothetical protein